MCGYDFFGNVDYSGENVTVDASRVLVKIKLNFGAVEQSVQLDLPGSPTSAYDTSNESRSPRMQSFL